MVGTSLICAVASAAWVGGTEPVALLEPSAEGTSAAQGPELPGLPMTSAERWAARDRRLVLHTALSGAFTGAAFLTVVGANVAPIAGACTGERGCAAAYAQFFINVMAIPAGVASGIALAVWASRLARHRRMQPPGLTWPGARVRVDPLPTGLRFVF